MNAHRRIAACAVLASAALGCIGAARADEAAQAPAEKPAAEPLVAEHLIDLTERVEAIRARHKVPALALAWVRDGQVVAAGVSGVRKHGAPVPVTIDDQWHIGSCTKAMTATLAAVLVEQGVIAWDATIAASFPELAAEMRESYRGATLKQLLAHRAGLPADNAPNPAQHAIWNAMRSAGESLAERRSIAVRAGLLQEPIGAPGEVFGYSNLGYTIAGAMLERATGRTYEELMQEHIFDPLGMASAGWGAPGTPGKIDQPFGHAPGLLGVKAIGPDAPISDNPAAMAPAGTCHVSIADWGRFLAAHARHGRDGTLVSPESFGTLHTPMGDEYALGWMVTRRQWAVGPVLTHGGSNTIWFAVVWMDAEKGDAFFAACNIASPEAMRACDEAVASVFTDPPGAPAPQAPQSE
jgi:CubicO group peptidase (beta-lactamase class C family)